MAFFHGPRVVELYSGGGAMPVPVWPDMQAPTILTPPTGAVDENHGYAIILAANEPVTFSILPGADGAAFTLDDETLTLPAQDYEAGKIIFTCNLRATDAAGNSTDFTHRVFIGDLIEIPANALTDPRPGFEGQFITDPRPGFVGQLIVTPEGYAI